MWLDFLPVFSLYSNSTDCQWDSPKISPFESVRVLVCASEGMPWRAWIVSILRQQSPCLFLTKNVLHQNTACCPKQKGKVPNANWVRCLSGGPAGRLPSNTPTLCKRCVFLGVQPGPIMWSRILRTHSLASHHTPANEFAPTYTHTHTPHLVNLALNHTSSAEFPAWVTHAVCRPKQAFPYRLSFTSLFRWCEQLWIRRTATVFVAGDVCMGMPIQHQ